MKNRILIFALICGALICLRYVGVEASPSATPMHKEIGEASCKQCHTCDGPTVDDPCLRRCLRHEELSRADRVAGPDTCVLDEIEHEYEAVVFNHRLHAEMSSMDRGCLDCHHFSEPAEISACKECHPSGISNENLKQPGLRGAYHRQCMGCHEEWAGDSQCKACHAKKMGGLTQGETEAPRPGRKYAKLEEPEIKVWESSYGGGTIVTLHHRSHTERYGIECAACHHAEGCSFCHSQDKSAQEVRHTETALHGVCNSCHEEMSCDQCHLKEVAQEFTHDRTGWPLKEYHEKVQCRACHGSAYHFTKPSTDCNACHRGWDTANFDHESTGLELDETHVEVGCYDCHTGGNFVAQPTGVSCHDADISYPDYVPGNRR